MWFEAVAVENQLAPPHSDDDFQRVAFVNLCLSVLAFRHNLAIHFYRDAFAGEFQFAE